MAVRTVRVGASRVDEYVHLPGAMVPPHQHTRAFISFTVSGEGTELDSGKQVAIAAGSTHFHPAGAQHAIVAGARPLQQLVLTFSEAHAARLAEVSGAGAKCAIERGGVLTWHAVRLRCELAIGSPASLIAAEGIVLEMLSAVAAMQTGQSSDPVWIALLRQIVAAEVHRPLTTHALAARVGVHPVHLARTWQRLYGCSLGDSIRRERVAASCRLLSDDAQSLSDIALASGFGDQTHFTRVFKKVTGLTPGAYRAQFRSPSLGRVA